MKVYRGVDEGEWQQTAVWVEEEGERTHPLVHHVHHSPDGFSWGYYGSGPSELAKDILWDYFNEEPTPKIYQEFKTAFVAKWPQDKPWELRETEITKWLEQYTAEELPQ